MRRKNQIKSGLAIKMMLLQRGQTITSLGAKINRPRSTVSQAIHQNRFPRVRKQIEEALGL